MKLLAEIKRFYIYKVLLLLLLLLFLNMTQQLI
jgi:hypothetical protein